MFLKHVIDRIERSTDGNIDRDDIKGMVSALGRMGLLAEDVETLLTVEETGWKSCYERSIGILQDGEEVVMLIEDESSGMISIYHHKTDDELSGRFDLVHRSAIAPTSRKVLVDVYEYGSRLAF